MISQPRMNAENVSRRDVSEVHLERTVSAHCVTANSRFESIAGSETDDPTAGVIARDGPTFHQSVPGVDQYTLLIRCLEDTAVRQ